MRESPRDPTRAPSAGLPSAPDAPRDVEGLDLDDARPGSPARAGRPVGEVARFALFVVNGLALVCSLLSLVILFMMAAMGAGTAILARLEGWLWSVAAVLCVAAWAFWRVTRQVAAHRRWHLRWQVVAGAALVVLVILGLTAPPGFWPAP